MNIPRACSLVLATLCALPSAQGRGDYLNVETPQVKPITVARIAGHDYLLVCNTPDNSVEIWDTDESVQPASARFLRRVPVGLEPSSVVWNAALGRFYTTDFLSDSVTSVVMIAPTGPTSLITAVERTVNVGDEPVHLAFTPDNSVAIVSLMSENAVGCFRALTLDPIPAGPIHPAPTDQIDLLSPGGTHAIREPRTVAVDAGNMLVIGHKGGNDATYDFDLYTKDLGTGLTTATGGLGSTNANMAIASNGDVWVVGGFARNKQLIGGPAVASATTGFVESAVWRSSNPALGAANTVSRDLNEVQGPFGIQPAAVGDALVYPTDVVVFEEGGTTKVFIAAMGSDRVGVLQPNSGAPITWALNRIDVPLIGGTVARATGPRGLAVRATNGPAPARVYVLNRIENSISVIDPVSETIVDGFLLSQNPEPDHLIDGRSFLYTAKLSLRGFASCAQCHTDGRTDGLAWDLGSPTGLVVPFGRYYSDGPTSVDFPTLANLVQNGFDPDKKLMVTQSLQGLLNFELPPESQEYTSNKPYHWRGDREDFVAFQEAFVGLFELPNIGTASEPKGIPDADMDAFEEFINTIHYPPNPHQPLAREYDGDFGTPNQNDGSGAARGFKLFHTQRLANTLNRSCVQCHALGEGSNNLFTVNQAGGIPGAGVRATLETAAIRGLFQREARLDRQAGPVSPIVTGSSGLEHAGQDDSLNDFLDIFGPQFTAAELLDLKRFVRQYDWGIAPVVGQVEPVFSNVSAANLTRIADFEAQAYEANAGLAVRLLLTNFSIARGFRFDPTTDLYVEEGAGTGGASLSRSALLALVTDVRDRATFFATPLGSERRFADPDGVADPAGSSTPSNLTFLSMVPNSANEVIPQLTKNWIPGIGPSDFDWQHPYGLPTPLSLHTMRLMQLGLVQAGNYGISAMRHDPPRRFRVRGEGILPGAVLWVHTPSDPSGVAPDTNGPLSQMQTTAIRVPIYATGDAGSPNPIAATWESAVEFDQMLYLTLMVGGPFAPGVPQAQIDFNSTIPESPTSTTFDPDNYNWHFIQVQNPGQAPVDIGWRQIILG